MMIFFPPISSVHFLKLGAHAWLTILPTSVEPVKLTRSTPSCDTSDAPAAGPSPITMFTTPRGNPASLSAFTRLYVESGVSSAGLITTVFPHTNAGVIFHDGIAMGKFHGVTSPATPIGARTAIANLFGSSDGVVCP